MRVGVDVVQVSRLAAVLGRRSGFRDRVFTAGELADARRGDVASGSATEVARLAARFAAKEATRKALGDLQLGWHEVEVRSAPDGAPTLYVHGEPSPLALSLSHDGGVAIAFVAGNATLGDAASALRRRRIRLVDGDPAVPPRPRARSRALSWRATRRGRERGPGVSGGSEPGL